MKRAIGWCAAWVLYWAGDAASRLIGHEERRTDAVVCRIYSTLMGWSARVQDWSGVNGPWSNP